MQKIINLTQHAATPDQLGAGVFEPADKAQVSRLLTFEEAPAHEEMSARARALARIARDSGAEAAMVGGAPFFMALLEGWLRMAGVTPVYAFSRRQSVEKSDPTGAVTKTQVFVHAGFVEGAVRLHKEESDQGYAWCYTATVVGTRSYHAAKSEDDPFREIPDFSEV